ncbi:MAG: flagella basal body P-ring formation protein FlgA, partial [Bryocella sp.]
GDRVKVVSTGEDSQLEMTGHAQDAGGLEDAVRVQLPSFSGDASSAAVIRCRVIGKDIVEMIR